jgi:hypothetical protein
VTAKSQIGKKFCSIAQPTDYIYHEQDTDEYGQRQGKNPYRTRFVAEANIEYESHSEIAGRTGLQQII